MGDLINPPDDRDHPVGQTLKTEKRVRVNVELAKMKFKWLHLVGLGGVVGEKTTLTTVNHWISAALYR